MVWGCCLASGLEGRDRELEERRRCLLRGDGFEVEGVSGYGVPGRDWGEGGRMWHVCSLGMTTFNSSGGGVILASMGGSWTIPGTWVKVVFILKNSCLLV